MEGSPGSRQPWGCWTEIVQKGLSRYILLGAGGGGQGNKGSDQASPSHSISPSLPYILLTLPFFLFPSLFLCLLSVLPSSLSPLSPSILPCKQMLVEHLLSTRND